MFYDSVPDTAVFKTSHHTIAAPLKEDFHGNIIVATTGEELREVLARVDSYSLFRDGVEISSKLR